MSDHNSPCSIMLSQVEIVLVYKSNYMARKKSNLTYEPIESKKEKYFVRSKGSFYVLLVWYC